MKGSKLAGYIEYEKKREEFYRQRTNRLKELDKQRGEKDGRRKENK